MLILIFGKDTLVIERDLIYNLKSISSFGGFMIEVISSSQNKLVKLAAALSRKKYRDETGLFLVEGLRLLEEAVISDWEMECCFITPTAREKERTQELVERLAARNIKVAELPETLFAKLAETEHPQGVLGIMHKKEYGFDDIITKETSSFIVVLESVQEPGNVGTLIRTADAAGCSGVIVTKGSADIFAGKTIRAAMGSVFHLPVVAGMEATEAIRRLKEEQIMIIATALSPASDTYYEVDMKGPVAIVFGNEGNGLPAGILAASDKLMHIPIAGRAESLNVSAAAAVILYDAVRQRRQQG